MEKVKILIVDDSDFLREAIKKFLEAYECDVFACHNGLEGLKIAVKEKPHLIFLDLMMPTFNGIDMLKSIKILDDVKNIPIVVITAHEENELVAEAERLGSDKILFKPLTRKIIFDTVDQILGNHILTKIKGKRMLAGIEQTAQNQIQALNSMKKNDSAEEEKTKQLPPFEQKELKRGLIKIFLRTAESKKRDVLSALEAKNEVMMRNLMHELKGTGSTIGYPKLSLLSFEVEKIIAEEEDIDWKKIEGYAIRVVSLLDLIQSDFNKTLS